MVLAASGSKSAAGATMRSAQQSNSNTANPRGPTGLSNSQPRNSPAGGGSPGAVSRGNYGTNSSSWSGGGGGGNNRSTASPRSGVQGSVSPTSGNSRGSNPISRPPNAAAAKASQALNAGLGRPSVPSRGLGTYTTNLGVGGAALGSFRSVNDVAVRNYVGAGLPVSRPGSYAGPKGTKYGLNDAAWAAGGGMIADPNKVAEIRNRLGYTPVGLRTNNPGNLLDGPFAQSQPGYAGPVISKNGLTYASFTRPDYGVMAKQTLLQDRYYDKRGLNTVEKIVDRYAPVDENNSAAANAGYKKALTNYLGVAPNTVLTRDQVGQLSPAMISYENAGNPYQTGLEAQQIAMSGTLGSPARQPAPPARPAVMQASTGQTNSLVDSIMNGFRGPSTLKDQDRLPNEATPPLASPKVQGNTTTIPVTPRATSVGGGLGIQAYNASVPSYRVVGTPAESTTAQRNAFYGSTPPAASTYSGYGTFNGPTIVTTPDPRADDPNYAGWRQTVVPAEPARVYDYPRKPYGTKTKTLINAPLGLVPIVGDINTGLGLAGYSVGDYIVNEENKLANMTPEQRDRYRAYWAEKRANAPGRGPENRGSRDLAMRSDPPPVQSKEPTQTSRPSKPASSTWEADAKAYGYTDAQLKDPETRDLIKQLWEMGFIPKSNPST